MHLSGAVISLHAAPRAQLFVITGNAWPHALRLAGANHLSCVVCGAEREGPCRFHQCSHSSVCIVSEGLPTCVCPSCSEQFLPVTSVLFHS